MSTVVACVVSRLKSTRLPRKAFADIQGIPLTQHLISRLRLSNSITKIVLCTSTNHQDEELASAALAWGVESFRGDEDDVLSRLIAVAERENAGHVLRVTGDNVLTCPANIDRMIKAHLLHAADYTRTNNLPVGVTAEVLSRDLLYRLRNDMADPRQSEYMMLYAFVPKKYRCAVLEAPPETNRPFYALTVDTPADIDLIRRIYASCASSTAEPAIIDAVTFLDNDPQYRPVDAAARVKMPNDQTATYGELIAMLNTRAHEARIMLPVT
jgi:spore coat polysaccharide biosynthesis protein SpsF